MIELSLLERFKIILNLVFSSPLFLVLLFATLLLFINIVVISKRKKIIRIFFIISSIIILVLLLNKYLPIMLNIIDTISKNIISIIYFPSILEYILVLIISLIILLISIFNKKVSTTIRNINLFVFMINMFNFFLILEQITNNKIDLTNKISIYSNVNLMALFELSLIIFAVWIIGLLLYKIIKKLTHNNEINNFYEEPELPKTIEELRKEILTPPPQVEYIVVEKKNDNDMFTLEEYRQMKKVLEYIKENQNKDSSN